MLSLEQLTIWDASVLDLISIAAALDCPAISLWVTSPDPQIEVPPLVSDPVFCRAVARRLTDMGVRLHNLEVFVLAPDTQIDDYKAPLETGARLGAKSATAIAFDAEEARVLDNFGRLCDLAAMCDLRLNAEFIAVSALNSLSAAARLVRASGRANAGITIDALHLYRSGGSPADVATLDPHLIGYAQVCDGPAEMPLDLQRFYEGFEQRQLPGDGVFPLCDFLAALPADVVVGVEVPSKSLRELGVSAHERARRAVEATRRLQAIR